MAPSGEEARPPAAGAAPPALPKGIRKEVLTRPSEEECLGPKKGDECTVHYVGRFEDEREFDASRTRGSPLTFRLGVGQVIDAWDLAVATMRRGEIASFTCAPEHCYGERGAPPKIPGNATLVFEIELIDWRRDDDLFGDGGVIRTKVEEGRGIEEASSGSEVLLSLTVTGADGAVIDERPELEYVLGEGALGPLSRAVDRALEDMKKGGEVLLTCSKVVGLYQDQTATRYQEYAYGDASPEPVTVRLALREVYEKTDVSPAKDKSVMKKLVREGEVCQNPKDGGTVRLTVHAAVGPDSAALAAFAGPTEMSFVAGDGEVCDALEFAVPHMYRNERAVITCTRPAACADSRLGLEGLAACDESGPVALTVELHDFDNGKPSWDMSAEEKVAHAAGRKEVGGRLFKAQRFELALQRYKQAADFLRQYATIPDGGDDIIRVCDLNAAACMLKVGDFFGAKSACTSVLAMEPDNVKALFRRASAQFELHEFTEAAADARKVLALDPVNREGQRLLAQAVRGAKQEQKNASSMFAKMNKALSGFADEEERLHREKKEAHEADIARKGAEARAEAQRLREQRGPRSAEACKEDMVRASQGLAEMQRKCWEMEMSKWAPPKEGG